MLKVDTGSILCAKLTKFHFCFSRPQLFSNDTKGFIIDYFDNYCAGVECFGDQTSHYVKVENGDVREGSAVEVADVNADACERYCSVRKLQKNIYLKRKKIINHRQTQY
jgi:hypothetical protein